MSNEMASSASASTSTVHGSSMEMGRTKLTFTPAGQPIGPNAATFSSSLGRIVRTHVPPIYNSWKVVPNQLKDNVWQHVLTLYDVPQCHRPCVLQRANAVWRDWKCHLRCEVYDKYDTDVVGKNVLPEYTKKEDWEAFVDAEGTYEAQLRRKKGKAARASLKSLHTSGRKGQARVADELRKQHPEREVTQCEIFIKVHYKEDGTPSSHHAETIRRMCERDPSISGQDIDSDGVAMVFGQDNRGRVRGLGLGVSRSIVHHSNPYKRAYEEEHKLHVALETEVDGLKSWMADMEKIVASLSQSGEQMRSSTDQGSSSQVRPPSTHQESQSNSRTRVYKLMHYRRNTIVACGSLMGVSPDNSDYYKIVLDEIVDGDMELIDGVRKMEDLMPGDMFVWLKFRTFPS